MKTSKTSPIPRNRLARLAHLGGLAGSVAGGVLAETIEWSFSTPPPKIMTKYPHDDSQPLEPLIFIAFDQRIDPAAVLKTIQVNAGGQPVSLELATEADIQANEQVRRRVKNAREGRWLVFRASESLMPVVLQLIR